LTSWPYAVNSNATSAAVIVQTTFDPPSSEHAQHTLPECSVEAAVCARICFARIRPTPRLTPARLAETVSNHLLRLCGSSTLPSSPAQSVLNMVGSHLRRDMLHLLHLRS
jgi:gamma-glutamyl:cysteine ligase YbdK (ATP-grasp superfamily)